MSPCAYVCPCCAYVSSVVGIVSHSRAAVPSDGSQRRAVMPRAADRAGAATQARRASRTGPSGSLATSASTRRNSGATGPRTCGTTSRTSMPPWVCTRTRSETTTCSFQAPTRIRRKCRRASPPSPAASAMWRAAWSSSYTTAVFVPSPVYSSSSRPGPAGRYTNSSISSCRSRSLLVAAADLRRARRRGPIIAMTSCAVRAPVAACRGTAPFGAGPGPAASASADSVLALVSALVSALAGLSSRTTDQGLRGVPAPTKGRLTS
ncbi:hypothetical protein SMD44_05351 [Streptomyces alboflavus]|uniref:Uncharacterized protein n=1 Tax=Streptomyces alboflavus TaxID=67267 RepID=A0A1Z1WHS5_9ACTN|nr:hypothetical protein SMD44_05351 [Streptomyces alboflavus]